MSSGTARSRRRSPVVGHRVRLVPFTEAHIRDDYIAWLNDKELMRYSQQQWLAHDRESCLAYLKGFDATPNYFWSIERLNDGAQVGTMTAYVDARNGVADVGILVGHPEARGTGVGREAWGLAMEHLFRIEGIRKITGGTVARNAPMLRIFRHWGMKLEGVRREQELIDGEPTDVLYFGIRRTEWEQQSRTGAAARRLRARKRHD